jgi:diguanylate cyclase (GGDEF)-like protein
MSAYHPDSRSDRVFYFGRDASILRELERRLAESGLALHSFERAEDLTASARSNQPALLILELGLVPQGQTPSVFVPELVGASRSGATSLVCVAESDGIAPRLQALRAGAKAFFVAPVEASELSARVAQICNSGSREPYRVLLIEDDESQARYISTILTNAGMQVRTLCDPLQVLDALTALRPDLVLTDIYMPGANGAEVAAIVRDHDSFHDMPILLISEESDPDKQLDALLLGGDAFVAKPVHRRRLVALVEHYVRLSHAKRERRAVVARRNVPRSLLDKTFFMRTLEQSLQDSGELGAGAAVLTLDIDGTQRIMERMGLSGIEKLAELVERRIVRQLETTDVAARLGDTTFAILARRKDRTALAAFAERLRRSVEDPKYPLGNDGASATVSIGIGFFDPLPADANDMASRAERAQVTARRHGGNRVEIWAPAGERTNSELRDLIVRALKGKGFAILFQPILALSGSEAMLFEAQLRLPRPDGELLPPREILPVAQQAGLMAALDRWVMECALDVLHGYRVRYPDLRVLVHQSLASVCRKDWVVWLHGKIQQHDLGDARPVLQIQMSEVRSAGDQAKALVELLHKLDVKVCIANVTNAAADVDLIGQVGADFAKLSFDMLSTANVGSLNELVGRLHQKGALVIAAGIDDQATVTRVWSSRADFIQGNYIQIAQDGINLEIPSHQGA